MAWSGWIELENRTVNSFGSGNRSHFLLYTKYRYNRSGTTVSYEIYSDLSYINDYGGSNSGTYNYPLGIKLNFNNTGDPGYVQVSSGGTWTHGALIGSYTWTKSITNTTGSGTVPIQTYANNMSTGSFDNPGWFSHSLTIPVLDNFTQAPTLTYTSATETTMNFSWSTSESCIKTVLYYKLSTASSYSTLTIYDNSSGATSGTGSLTGLTAGKTYNIYAKCTKKDSGGNTRDSSTLSKNTYAYPSISSIGTSSITIPAPGGSVNQSITLSNPLSRSVTVSAKIGSTSIATSQTTTGTSVTLSLSANNMYTGIGGSAKNGTITYTCAYGSTSSNTATSTCVTSATNCGPTVSANPTYTNTNSTHSTLVGTDTIIQGKSSFSVTSPAITTRGGASVSKYYFKIGNGSYENNGTTATKTYSSTSSSGSVIAYCYAEDSRGYTSTVKQVTMRVLSYSEPSANVTVARNGYSTSATITVISATRSVLSKSNATSTDVNNWRGNTSSNKISVSITSGPTLSASVIGTTSATMSNQTVNITNASLSSSYTVTLNISDRITTKSVTYPLDKASPILSLLNTNRVGVNKVDPSCALDVNGDAKVSGSLTVNNASVLTSIPTASSSVLGGIKVGSYLTISNGVLSGNYSAATQSVAGLMSAADKKKLDGVATNANNYSLPTASTSTKGGIKVGNNLTISNEVLSMAPTNLYNNTTGSNSSVTLSQTSANFVYLEIHFKILNMYYCTRVYGPNGKSVGLMGVTNENTVLQMGSATATISTNKITLSNQQMINVGVGTCNNWNASNIYIVRVDGYK